MAEGRGEAAFPEAPGNETEGWPRCRLLRRGPPPAAGPGRPVAGSALQRSGARLRGSFRKEADQGTFPWPGCPVPAQRRRREEGREGCGGISADKPSPSCRVPNNRFPISSLQPPSGERGFSLHPASVARLSPFPGFTFLISFFLDYIFYALVRLDKSIPRFPLPAPFSRGLISQLDFNYWFVSKDAGMGAAVR